MRAILIDPEHGEVKEFDFDYTDYKDICAAVGCDLMAVAFSLPNGDACFVDDEGLINGRWTDSFTFNHPRWGAWQPFNGRGLILGTGEDGESIDAVSPLEEIRSRVTLRPGVYGCI